LATTKECSPGVKISVFDDSLTANGADSGTGIGAANGATTSGGGKPPSPGTTLNVSIRP
jgi:hypothetical protein